MASEPLCAEFVLSVSGLTVSLRVEASPEALLRPAEDSKDVCADGQLECLFRSANQEALVWLEQARRAFERDLEKAWAQLLAKQVDELTSAAPANQEAA